MAVKKGCSDELIAKQKAKGKPVKKGCSDELIAKQKAKDEPLYDPEKDSSEGTTETTEQPAPVEVGAWLIETYDANTQGWEASNLNAIGNIEWIRKAKVQNDPKTLQCHHSFDWCVETIKKASRFHRDFNPVEYRLVNTEVCETCGKAIDCSCEDSKDEVIPCSIFM